MASTIIHCNKGKIDQFCYGVTLVKKTQEGTQGKQIDIGTVVSDFDIYQSLNTMAMQLQLTIVDAADALAVNGIQPGDMIEIQLFKDVNDKNKIDSTFSILTIDNSKRIQNSKGRIYKISGLSTSALYNKKATVTKSYNLSVSDIVQDICVSQLKIPSANLQIESTAGQRKMIIPGYSPYKIIGRAIPMAVSAESGPSLYFFYENNNGFFFKSLAKIIKDGLANNIWNYSLSIEVSRNENSTDIYKIIDFHHINISDQAARMDKGIYENELMQFHITDRTIISKKYNYKDSYKDVQQIAKNSVVDLTQNYPDFVTDPSVDTKGVRTYVHTRSDETAFGMQNSYEQNFNHALASVGLLNQHVFFYELNGNPAMNVGDIINITAASLSGKTVQEHDKHLTGNFLIGNLRHHMDSGETFETYINGFSDSPASKYAEGAQSPTASSS